MTDGEIECAIKKKELRIDPFDKNRLEPASYDARVGKFALPYGSNSEIDLRSQSVEILPGNFALLVTREKFKLGPSIAANLGLPSYYARKGLMLLVGLQIDPGFEGNLVIGVYNIASRMVVLDYESPIVMVQFHRLSQNVKNPYVPGADQKLGKIPRADKDYIRPIEVLSLSEMAANMSTLDTKVEIMQSQLNLFRPVLLSMLAMLTAIVAIVVSILIPN